MSNQNVDLVRRLHELLGGGELFSVAPERLRAIMSELLDPGVEWHDQRELPGASVHRGIDNVLDHFARSREALDYDRAELLELLDAGGSVVAGYRFHARGRTSGVAVEREATYVWSFLDAKVRRVNIFGTREEGLAAAGLKPSDPGLS